jgi:hypothetical protein
VTTSAGSQATASDSITGLASSLRLSSIRNGRAIAQRSAPAGKRCASLSAESSPAISPAAWLGAGPVAGAVARCDGGAVAHAQLSATSDDMAQSRIE